MNGRRDFLKKSFLAFTGITFFPGELFAGGQETSQSNYELVADILGFRLSLYDNGEKVGEYSVSVGKPSTPTPVGKYKILAKADWDGTFAGSWMQFKKNIYQGKDQGGWGIHGYPHAEFIGHATSQGCLGMIPDEAKELKRIVPVGTPIKNSYQLFLLGEDGSIEIRPDIYSMIKKQLEELAK